MHFEIERKFLVKRDDWLAAATSARHLQDGLVSQTDRGKVRVRMDGTSAWLTVKGPRSGISRVEYEYEIPVDDARHLIAEICVGRLIEKTRHCVPSAGAVWTVDVFHGRLEGLVWAEIELTREDQPFQRPDWVGEEVTADPRFRHSNLLALCAMGDGPVSISTILASAGTTRVVPDGQWQNAVDVLRGDERSGTRRRAAILQL